MALRVLAFVNGTKGIVRLLGPLKVVILFHNTKVVFQSLVIRLLKLSRRMNAMKKRGHSDARHD